MPLTTVSKMTKIAVLQAAVEYMSRIQSLSLELLKENIALKAGKESKIPPSNKYLKKRKLEENQVNPPIKNSSSVVFDGTRFVLLR